MVRLLNIEEAENNGIKLNFELMQWAKIWKFGNTHYIRTSDSLLKDEKLRKVADGFINGAEVKDLLNTYKDEYFSLSLVAGMIR